MTPIHFSTHQYETLFVVAHSGKAPLKRKALNRSITIYFLGETLLPQLFVETELWLHVITKQGDNWHVETLYYLQNVCLSSVLQFWSLTQFYSVDFSQSRIGGKSVFSTNAQSRFASVVVGGVLGPPHLGCP